MLARVINFLAFQLGWFACVVFAADGRPWIGPAIVVALAAAQLLVFRRPASDISLLAGAAAMGFLADSILVWTGALAFPEAARQGALSPAWMAALWVNFAMTIPMALSWLRGKFWYAAALGALGGPLAYWAGIGLGAIEAPLGALPFVLAVGGEWALAAPALVAVAEVCGSFESTSPASRPTTGVA